MKVKRMKSGFSIRCNDGDYAMLQVAVASMDPKGLHGDAKAAHTRRTKLSGGDLLKIDVDHRVAA